MSISRSLAGLALVASLALPAAASAAAKPSFSGVQAIQYTNGNVLLSATARGSMGNDDRVTFRVPKLGADAQCAVGITSSARRQHLQCDLPRSVFARAKERITVLISFNGGREKRVSVRVRAGGAG